MSAAHDAGEPAAGVTVERIGSAEALEALGPEWERLQDATPWKHVLLDHRWMCAWWRAFGAGKQLHVLVLRRGGEVVGIAPMIVSRGWEAFPDRDTRFHLAEDYAHMAGSRWRRCVPIRRVSFPINIACHNERAHFLFPVESEALYAAVFDYWRERRGEWDLMVLEGLPRESAQHAAVAASARERDWRALPQGRTVELFSADIAGTMDDYLASRSRHFRKRQRRAVRANEDHGRIATEEYRGERIGAGLDQLFELERRSWKADPQQGRAVSLTLDDRMRAFLRDVAGAFARSDDAQVLVMTCDGAPFAGVLALGRQTTLLTLVTYMDEARSEQLTTATLWWDFVERALAAGYDRIDFNGNTVAAQKLSNASDVYVRRTVFHDGPYARVLGAAKAGATWISSRRRAGRERRKGGPGDA